MAGFFQDTSGAIINPLSAIWVSIVEQLPGIVGAIIVLIVGCFVAVILGHALKLILEHLKVDDYVRKAHLTRAIGHTHVPAVAGEVLKWWIIIMFLQQAVDLMDLGTLSVLLGKFALWLPNVVIAVLVLLFGIAVGNYVHLKIEEHSKQRGSKAAGVILKFVIIIMFLLIGVRQIGLDVSLAEDTFKLIIGALAGGIALALGIGLGLGLRKESENFVRELRKNF